jgi:hypothetical protein
MSVGGEPEIFHLGLTLSREIAEAHGGRLTVAPRDGGGTVVSVWLPDASRGARLPERRPNSGRVNVILPAPRNAFDITRNIPASTAAALLAARTLQ